MDFLDISAHPWIYHIVFSLTRWLHLVATALLLGGILFYEFVIPLAISDMKDEHQLSVVGRVRFYFAGVVWLSAAILLITGVLTYFRHSESYFSSETQREAWPWAMAHIVLGSVTLVIAMRLVFRPRVPPMSWMRLNFVLLLVVVFLASTSRHVRLFFRERELAELRSQHDRVDSAKKWIPATEHVE